LLSNISKIPFVGLPISQRRQEIKVEFITTKEAENIRRRMPKSKTVEEYEGYLKQIPDGKIGKFEVAPKDGTKPQNVRSRSVRAGKSLTLNVETKRVGNIVLFWC
jgi:hypothetical protein